MCLLKPFTEFMIGGTQHLLLCKVLLVLDDLNGDSQGERCPRRSTGEVVLPGVVDQARWRHVVESA